MSRTKWKITLQNIRLTDVPTRQNRMFLKIKNCISTVITKSYQIINNQCEFTDSVEIEVSFPTDLLKAINKNQKNLKIKPLRLSFRLENSSRSGFQRYGIVMVDLLKLIMENNEQSNESNLIFSYRTGLENCSEKPIFSVNFVFPNDFLPKSIVLKPSNDEEINDISISPKSKSKSNANNSSSQYSSPKCSQSSQTKSTTQNTINMYGLPSLEKQPISTSASQSNTNKASEKNNSCTKSIPTKSTSNPTHFSSASSKTSKLFENRKDLGNIPIHMTKQRFDEIEGEIDNLLAGIINDESIQ